MSFLNTASDFVILIGSLWILLTSKILIRTGGSLVLAAIGLGSLGNIVSHQFCPSYTEVMLKMGVAIAVTYSWYKIEARTIFRKPLW